jgi:hypothetical protein
MTRDQVLEVVRRAPRTYAKTPGECRIMGHNLSEFPPEEQAEILLWALEDAQKETARYRAQLDFMQSTCGSLAKQIRGD